MILCMLNSDPRKEGKNSHLSLEYNKSQKYCDKRIIWSLINLGGRGMPKHETKQDAIKIRNMSTYKCKTSIN